MNLVVMGGSFNPPTAAHWKILETTMDTVGAEKGFLVPARYAYLKRKMVRSGQSHLCLPDELRIRLLQAMTASDPRIQIFTETLGDPFSNDRDIMNRIRSRYKNWRRLPPSLLGG